MNHRQIFRRLFGIGAIVSIAYATYALSLHPVKSSRQDAPPPRCDRVTVSLPSPLAVGPARPVLADYKQAIRQDLFTAPQPGTRPPAQQEPAPAARPPALSEGVSIDPLADAVYSGSVTSEEETTALIESRSSRQGTYVSEGDQWQGFRILSVSPTEVTLSMNGTIRRLPKADTITIVPLSADAPGNSRRSAPGAGGPTSSVFTLQNQVHF